LERAAGFSPSLLDLHDCYKEKSSVTLLAQSIGMTQA
jgi:hypothetical protein